MHVKGNIYIWIIELMIFFIMFFNMVSLFTANRLFGKLAIVTSLILPCAGVLIKSIHQSKIKIKKQGIGIYILCFVTISTMSSIINYKGEYPVYNAVIVLTLFASVYYCLTSKMTKNKQQISNFFFGVEIILATIYLIYRFNAIDQYLFEMNTIYFIILLLPLILMNENKFVVLFGTLLIAFLTVISFKRTAFLMILVALVVYIILLLNKKSISLNKKVTWGIIILSLSLIVYYLYVPFATKSEITVFERLGSIAEDGGSGRNIIYSRVINEIKEFTIIEWLLGRGYNAVAITTKIGTSAHNDFLEIMFDYGIIALFVYCSLIIRICNITAKMFKKNYDLACIGVVAIILFMFMSSFSHLIIYPTYILYFIVFWSVLLYENYAY